VAKKSVRSEAAKTPRFVREFPRTQLRNFPQNPDHLSAEREICAARRGMFVALFTSVEA